MRKGSVLKQFVLAASLSAIAFPAFAQSETPQLPGSGAMEGTDRTGTTGPSGSEAFDPSDGAVDATARMAKPAGDIAATDTDRDLAARIRMAVEGDPALGSGLDKSLHIKVDNGAVTLLGQVRNEQAKEQINAKVKALAGAHSVDNQLLIAQ
jgi:hypothetical protein